MTNLLDYCEDFPEVSLKPGEYLLEEGTKSGLFFLIEGEFEIVKQGFQINKVSEPGSIFGEISALLDIPHLASVMALSLSRLYVIEDPVEFLRSNIEIPLHLSTVLAQRLNVVTSYMFELKNQLGEDFDQVLIVDQVLETLAE
ncbi:MAG: cyclic nucleotide-binding domain-containing protein [Candidatus Dadabacteria bacterium]|nr:cyclic nucleotide-binding domain-containing protein [Candidatus Dadabacteria bacterium]NIY22897.1 cyclic nucleotide-binding domain-containing protein [Candidatus Dadabacteria bacterium]